MSTKKTILSEKELNLLEEIISKFGLIVNFEQVYSLLQEKKDRQSIRKLVSKFTKNGWLVPIKKGLYTLASLESRGILSISPYKIAQVLFQDSFISFEAALQHHGMFDQMLRGMVSISTKQHSTREIQGIRYKFVSVSDELFFGWMDERVENFIVKVASKERAVLDLIAFNRSEHSMDLIFEKLSEYQTQFDFKQIQILCQKYSKTVQKILGFILDKLSIDSTYLYNHLMGDKGVVFMTKDSDLYSKKWHLYFHRQFEGEK